jgi:hypothetical protein
MVSAARRVQMRFSSVGYAKRKTASQEQPQQLQQQEKAPSRPSSEYELLLLEKQKFEATDVMSFRFSKKEKQKRQQVIETDGQGSFLNYTAGQYDFDIDGVYNDPKGPTMCCS